ncbi:MAG TPA: N-acetylmuramoyl-L-alanine amidase [Dehalococcoidia bacterium]|nr:N-acetylmuramoyl-L-alanine amidase [Dehalococcoidia bacterium]
MVAAIASLACGVDNGTQKGPEQAASYVVIEPLVESAAEPLAQESHVALVPARPQRERKLVVLDPGHGGDEVGSASNGVIEKQSNLDMALRVEQLLIDHGVDVLLTRRGDARAANQIAGYTAARSDIQARIDLANSAYADVFVSIHSNGSTDAGQRGVEVWYDSSRSFAGDNLQLAHLLKDRVLGELRHYGYAAQDRGIFDGQCFRQRGDRCVSLFVLGGARQTSREEIERRGGDPESLGFRGDAPVFSRPTEMPGALVELLIVTNAADAAVLRDERGRQAMARGVAAAVMEFLAAKEGG